jgi:hypothetical protein
LHARQSIFADAIAETEKLIARTAAVIQRAKSRSHGEIYEHVDHRIGTTVGK